MTFRDLGRVEVEPLSGDSTWLVWNLKYGRHTDSGDMGYIQKVGDEYEAFSRGDIPRSLGKHKTLDAAIAILQSVY